MKLSERIERNLLNYLQTRTHTGTELERNNETFFKKWFDLVPYLKRNPEYCGFYEMKNDTLNRSCPWALLKGEGTKTIVMIHHTDTVDTDDYGKYKQFAYTPDELEKHFRSENVEMDEISKEDLYSGKWMFGRGASDMKGGASIALSLFEEYSGEENFKGNILLMGVPDEENLSAGMRSAVMLMKELREKYELEYAVMLNVEPHERNNEDEITIYDGSVGKMMPIFLVRGKLAHVSQIYNGFNPITLLSKIVVKTDLNPDFMEKSGNTVTPPPTWLYFKDRKYVYDVSLPLSAGGYMSVLTLTKSPKEILDQLKKVSIEAFEEVISSMKLSYDKYKSLSEVDSNVAEWKPNVKFYGEVYREIKEKKGDVFTNDMAEFQKELEIKINKNEINRIDGAYLLIEKTLEHYDDLSPMVVIALAPPYYPSINNSMLNNSDEANELLIKLDKFASSEIGSGIYTQNYFTGISDLSYAAFTADSENIDYISSNMIFWGDTYYIPLDTIKEQSVPVLNIGPWGRDLHKYTERVYKKDLFEDIPRLIDFTVRNVLNRNF